MFMNNEFLIVKNMKIFINSIDNIIVNYPRKEMIIKTRLLNDSLDILENIYLANYYKDKNKRIDLQIKVLSKISMLDYYLERSYNNKYISEKVCINKCNQLSKITKLINGQIKSESKH